MRKTENKRQVVLKLPNIEDYKERLLKAVIDRKGKYDDFLGPQIDITADLWRNRDILSAAMGTVDILVPKSGSTGQVNYVMNPLWEHYDKMNRTLLAQMKALGLNYDIAPEKVSESDVVNNDDPLSKMLNG